MGISLEFKKEESCEQIYSLYDRKSGLKAIIAIHNTTLGAAIGGCRMMDYISENEALADVTRLAKNMTYKSAMTSVKHGGGKSVILKQKNSLKTNWKFSADDRHCVLIDNPLAYCQVAELRINTLIDFN